MSDGYIIEGGILKDAPKNDKYVSIPDDVVRIGKGAFKNSDVESITFAGNNLKSIDEEAFANCKALKSVILPEGIVQIGDRAFAGCSSLSYIAIPNSVMLVGTDVLNDCKKDVFIIGKEGTEAADLAKKYGYALKTEMRDSIAAFEKLNENRAEMETRVFDLFGENVTCSNSITKFHDNLEYYAGVKESVFQRIYKRLPLSIPGEFGDMLSVLQSEQNNVINRLSKNGVFATADALNCYILEPYKALLEAVTAIKDAYISVATDMQNGINNNREALFNEAESKVTGLSYGIIGGGLDMLAYSIDDFRERQRQRKAAYAEAEKKAKEFKEKHTSEGNRRYTEFITKALPYIHQGTDFFVDSLCRAENDLLIKAGLIDPETVKSIDIQKSLELIERISDKPGDNSFVVALALKMYPCNIAALVYAREHHYDCKGMEDLISFLKLDEKIRAVIQENKTRRFNELTGTINNVSSANEGILIIKRNTEWLDDWQIKSLLATIATKITPSVETIAAPESIDRISNARAYCLSKLSNLISKDTWDFFSANSIQPIRSSAIPNEASLDYSKLVEWLFQRIDEKIKAVETKYEKAKELSFSAKKSSELESAASLFRSLSSYKDSKLQCQRLEAEIKVKRRKEAAVMSVIIVSIVAAFVAVNLLLTKVIIPNAKYNSAMKLYEAGEYNDAYSAFAAMDGYRDSNEMTEKCKDAIFDAAMDKDYSAAMLMYDAGQYEEARKAFLALNGYKDSAEQAVNCENAIKLKAYNAAVDLYNSGEYEEAIAAFTALNGFLDSDEKIEIIKQKLASLQTPAPTSTPKPTATPTPEPTPTPKPTATPTPKPTATPMNVAVGDIITFGHYEQDNKSSNGKEEIEWIVLAKEGNQILIISKYALDCQPFNSDFEDVTWETCSLRKWLNSTFINSAFSAEEQNKIISSTITADKNPKYDTTPGNSTVDKVFILSQPEAKRFFTNKRARKCQGTAYCFSKGATKDDDRNCLWWLRTPGYNQCLVVWVVYDGRMGDSGYNVDYDGIAVRPALWIDLSNLN